MLFTITLSSNLVGRNLQQRQNMQNKLDEQISKLGGLSQGTSYDIRKAKTIYHFNEVDAFCKALKYCKKRKKVAIEAIRLIDN